MSKTDNWIRLNQARKYLNDNGFTGLLCDSKIFENSLMIASGVKTIEQVNNDHLKTKS